MKYNKLFKQLSEYAFKTTDLNIKHFKEISQIIWNNMSPTECDLFRSNYHRNILLLSHQESLEYTLERIKEKTKS